MMKDEDDARRCKRLGDVGEQLAPMLLKRAGFTGIVDLNGRHYNYPFGDFLAERNSTRYVISVKTRNKWELPGPPKLNSRYRLGEKCEELAAAAEERERAVAAWLAISVAPSTFDAFFGTVQLLLSLGLNAKGIQMTEKYTRCYECLARSERHNLDYGCLKNLPG